MKKQFSCNHNGCNGANSQFEPPYNFTYLRPTEKYTLEDEFLDFKSSEAYSSNVSSQTQDKSADEYPWRAVSCLKQKACRVLKSDSEFTSAISEYTYHSQEMQFENCGHNLKFLKKAKELMDYDPESVFLKKMKEQYVQQNSQILMPAFVLNNPNASLPYDCQDCLAKAREIIRIGEDLRLKLTDSCLCKHENNIRQAGRDEESPDEERPHGDIDRPYDRIVPPYYESRPYRRQRSVPRVQQIPQTSERPYDEGVLAPYYEDRAHMRQRSLSRILQAPQTTERVAPKSREEKEDKKKKAKSQHISRSKKPRRCKGKRVRLSDGSVKCESENEFEPTLKRPHENSCERCWRFASPPRSPVNKPDQKYDPNFRKARSQTFVGDGRGDANIAKEVSDVQASPRDNVKSSKERRHPRSAIQARPHSRTASRKLNKSQTRSEESKSMQKEWQEQEQRRQREQQPSQVSLRWKQLSLTQRQQPQTQNEHYVSQERPRQQQPRGQQQIQQPYLMPQQRYQKQEHQKVHQRDQEQMRPQRRMYKGQRVSSKQRVSPIFMQNPTSMVESSFTQAPEKNKVAGTDKVSPASAGKRSSQDRKNSQQLSGYEGTEFLSYNDFAQGLEETEYLPIAPTEFHNNHEFPQTQPDSYQQPSQYLLHSTRSPFKDVYKDKYGNPPPSKRLSSYKNNELKPKALPPECSNASPETPTKTEIVSPKSPRQRSTPGSKTPPSTRRLFSPRRSIKSEESNRNGPIVHTIKAEVHRPPRSRTPSPRKSGNISKKKLRKTEKPKRKQLPRTPSPDIQVIEEGSWVINEDPPARTPTHTQQAPGSSRDQIPPDMPHFQESNIPGQYLEGYRKRYFSCHCFANGKPIDSSCGCGKSTCRYVYENACPCSGSAPPRVRIPPYRENITVSRLCPFLRDQNNQSAHPNPVHLSRDEYNSMYNRTFRNYKSNFPNQNLTGNMGGQSREDTQWMSMRSRSPGTYRPFPPYNPPKNESENMQWTSMHSRYGDQQQDMESTVEEDIQWRTMMPTNYFNRTQNPYVAHQNLNGHMESPTKHSIPGSITRCTSYPESQLFNVPNNSGPPRQSPIQENYPERNLNWAGMRTRNPFANKRPNSTPQNTPNRARALNQENDQFLNVKSPKNESYSSGQNFAEQTENPNAPKSPKESMEASIAQDVKPTFRAPRRYFVFYMTKGKENEKNDVEVLVEEFGKKIHEKKDTEAKELKEKMKKVLECKSDSMALRFEKGVYEPCRNPPSSRTLYF